jgi:crotonobetainyl-CoA:carnitine CoA-transferase CaiB-like acyl-CoA transferase
MFAAQGIVLALLARAETGRGQHVDVGMLDAVASLLTYQAAIYFATGVPPNRIGNRHPTIAPYETFEVSDGELVVAVGNDDLWRRFCRAAGLDSLAEDPRFAKNRDRVLNHGVLRPVLAEALRRRSRADWTRAFEEAGVPVGAVRDLGEVLTDEQLRAREMVESVVHPTAGDIQVLGVPIKLSETPGRVVSPPPRLGEHTERVLTRDLGLVPEQVEALRQAGVI